MEIQITDFNITQTLECGQIFRFYKIEPDNFNIIVQDKVVNISQREDQLFIENTTLDEFNLFWKNYLDLDTNYKIIKDTLCEIDIHMNNAIRFGGGIRILKQDPFEMLISFIISQNKAIPHIKQCINNIAERFGQPIFQEISSETYYAFPTLAQLQAATIDDLSECKVGFRAAYIKDAIDKLSSGEVDLTSIASLETADARKQLMKIKGVGKKIADCVLLFAYYRTDVFPTDVWIKRVVEGFYFNQEETKLEVIDTFAKNTFKDFAGFAQQYLFFYARENNLFKKNAKDT
ncbi:DNA-3-methyladenine glycosylase family protein [Candidatus Epulonipiscium viviparus]|uniref:DNA-3-methyladenine glycosylase family protein n=1 Tax=Candidatus Epulonipiscium viviparus TaxID=420336 RepID=UPI002738143C|nr:DNA glycosylase [Candidatus Epulopiscium viviparus]